MSISCIIVEDEPLAQERLQAYIAKLPFLELKGQFANGADALVYLNANKTDLVFLDINLGELSGIKLLETGLVESEVILTTAYDMYALKGYELNVTDYLLKPFTFERWLQAVEKVRKNIGRRETKLNANVIFIKTENRLEKLLLNDVLFIEGMRDYRKIHTPEKRIMTLKTFREFEAEIPQGIICRVHKSFMVGLDKIDKIERGRIRIQDIWIPVSQTYKQAFFDLVENKNTFLSRF